MIVNVKKHGHQWYIYGTPHNKTVRQEMYVEDSQTEQVAMNRFITKQGGGRVLWSAKSPVGGHNMYAVVAG